MLYSSTLTLTWERISIWILVAPEDNRLWCALPSFMSRPNSLHRKRKRKKIKWSTKEKEGKREFFYRSAVPSTQPDVVPEPERSDQRLTFALQETPSIQLFPCAKEIIFHMRKMYFLITELGNRHF